MPILVTGQPGWILHTFELITQILRWPIRWRILDKEQCYLFCLTQLPLPPLPTAFGCLCLSVLAWVQAWVPHQGASPGKSRLSSFPPVGGELSSWCGTHQNQGPQGPAVNDNDDDNNIIDTILIITLITSWPHPWMMESWRKHSPSSDMSSFCFCLFKNF